MDADMKKIVCGCGSKMVAVVGQDEDVKEMLARHRRELVERASLVEAYGWRAVVALGTYGVGAKTAARVLGRLRKDNLHFFADLLEAQKQFIRTRQYWQMRRG